MPDNDGVLVVWTIAGSPLWAGAVGAGASLSLDILRWDLNALGALVSGMTALFGNTRLSRLTLAASSRQTISPPSVDVLACRGVLCIVAVVSLKAADGATDLPRRDPCGAAAASCLDHPLAPLLLMGLSLLEPLCSDEAHSDDTASNHGAPPSAVNPLAAANPFAAKTTPTNSLCLEVATPGAPIKNMPPPDTPAKEAAEERSGKAVVFQPRWRAVTQTLINAATADAARRRHAEGMSGKQVMQEASRGLLLGECIDSPVPLSGTAQELVDTMKELLMWWKRHSLTLTGKSLWIIMSTTRVAAGQRVDEVHPASSRNLYCPAVHRWLTVQVPAPRSDGPTFIAPNAVHHEGLVPVCAPLRAQPQAATGGVDEVLCIAVVKGAHATPSTLSVVISDLHHAGWAAEVLEEWNALAAMATSVF
jgi:hypothetical protein